MSQKTSYKNLKTILTRRRLKNDLVLFIHSLIHPVAIRNESKIGAMKPCPERGGGSFKYVHILHVDLRLSESF